MFKTQKQRETFSYQRLGLADSEGLLSTPITPNDPKPHYRVSSYVLWMIICAQAVALALAFLIWRRVGVSAFATCKPDLLYSPAQDAIEYQLKIFRSDPVFTAPPSDALDKAWGNLYQFGISRIPREQARMLPNKTSPIPGDEGYYIAELEVFHNLHCLNMIRQRLHSEHYSKMRSGNDVDDVDAHISHCVESLRQALMCASDISTIVWQWNEQKQKTLGFTDVARTCRNFEAIQEWGRENQLRVPFNNTIHVHDDDMAIDSTGYEER